MQYQEVQKIAKDTINFARNHIHSGMSLLEIRELCRFVTLQTTFMGISEKIYITLNLVKWLNYRR